MTTKTLVYISRHPSKDKKDLFSFMEQNKIHGSVSARKLQKYLNEKRIKAYRFFPPDLKKSNKYFILGNRRGTELGRVGMNKNKRIDWWFIN